MSRQGLPSRETSSGGELASEAQLAGERVGQGRGGRRQGPGPWAQISRNVRLPGRPLGHCPQSFPGLLQALLPNVLQKASLLRHCLSRMAFYPAPLYFKDANSIGLLAPMCECLFLMDRFSPWATPLPSDLGSSEVQTMFLPSVSRENMSSFPASFSRTPTTHLQPRMDTPCLSQKGIQVRGPCDHRPHLHDALCISHPRYLKVVLGPAALYHPETC